MKKVKFAKGMPGTGRRGAAGSADAVADVIEALDVPLRESRKRLPEAGRYLEHISAQTEAAARTMLVRIEQIIASQNDLIELLDILARSLRTSHDAGAEVCIDRIARIKNIVGVVQNDAFSVLEALQFQDVSGQYVQETSSVLSDVERHLRSLHIMVAGIGARESNSAREYEPEVECIPAAAHAENQQDVDAIVMRTVGKPGS